MAVAHGMDGVLAVSVPLGEEALGQTAGFGEGVGLGRVTKVHHLVDGEQGLVAPLLSFPQLLRTGQGGCSEHRAADMGFWVQRLCI